MTDNTFIPLDRTVPEYIDILNMGLLLQLPKVNIRIIRNLVPSWTQAQLSEVIGISVSSIRKMSMGKHVRLTKAKELRIRASHAVMAKMLDVLDEDDLLQWFHSARWCKSESQTPLERLRTKDGTMILLRRVLPTYEYTVT